jgi:phosphatidylserine decarboxylase
LKIARDGYPLIGFVFFMFVGSLFFSPPVAFFLIPLLGLAVWFFRDPEREPDGPGFVSPADGKIVEVFMTTHPFTGSALKIGIFMNPLDVHVNRAPEGGRVEWLEYVPGKKLPAFRPKASELNERMYVGLETGHGPVLLVQIAGFLARRIVCRLRKGDRLERGERFGMIKLGSKVDVYLPPEFQPKVKPGDRVYAGRTVLGGMSVEE